MGNDIRDCHGTCGEPHVFCLGCFADRPLGYIADPCSNCGESQKRVTVDCRKGLLSVSSTVTGQPLKLRVNLADTARTKFKMWSPVKLRRNQKCKKPNWEVTFASNYSTEYGHDVHVSIASDRVENEYRKYIQHPDGRVLHEVRHRLNEHIGHGTAKRPSSDTLQT
jgi:hypothetical protein